MNIRKRQVLEQAQQLFVEKGVMNTSVQDILTKSQISKGTFYNYFPSKNHCLKAILDLGQEETKIRRQELLIGQNRGDKSILAKQIAIRLQVNVDHNLLPIIEAIFHSGDAELRHFSKKHHLAELQWLSGRLVDVYGKDTRPYAADCAVLLTGMLQHMLHFVTASSLGNIDLTKLINFIMRRVDEIMPSMIRTQDVLLGEELFHFLSMSNEEVNQTKQQLLEDLATFGKQLTSEEQVSSEQYMEFLIEELDKEFPRTHLLETVARSFRESFVGTVHEHAARKLASEIWIYIESKQQ